MLASLATWEPWQLGILGGTVVYITSIVVVLYLLIAGGSFKRMKEQVRSIDEGMYTSLTL